MKDASVTAKMDRIVSDLRVWIRHVDADGVRHDKTSAASEIDATPTEELTQAISALTRF